MDLPKRFHIKTASRQDFDSALAFLHKKGYKWFHGDFLDSPEVSTRYWGHMHDIPSPYICGVTTYRAEGLVIPCQHANYTKNEVTQ